MAQQSHCWAYICTKLIFKKTRTPVFIAALVTMAAIKKSTKINAGEGAGEREPSYTVGGNTN